MAVEQTSKPGYREFNALKSDGKRTLLSVRLPYQKELQYADIEMSVAFNRAQKAGLPVRARLLRELKTSEQWTDKDQNELNDLRQVLKTAQETFTDLLAARDKLDKGEKLDKVEADLLTATSALQEARQTYGERVSEFNSMTQHCADEKADIVYRNYLIACVTERAADSAEGKKGTRLFNAMGDFLNCNDPPLVERLIFEFQACQNNMPSEWTAADKAEAEAEAEAKAQAEADAKAKTEADAKAKTAEVEASEIKPTAVTITADPSLAVIGKVDISPTEPVPAAP